VSDFYCNSFGFRDGRVLATKCSDNSGVAPKSKKPIFSIQQANQPPAGTD
jgi:hypothetical protein